MTTHILWLGCNFSCVCNRFPTPLQFVYASRMAVIEQIIRTASDCPFPLHKQQPSTYYNLVTDLSRVLIDGCARCYTTLTALHYFIVNRILYQPAHMCVVVQYTTVHYTVLPYTTSHYTTLHYVVDGVLY